MNNGFATLYYRAGTIFRNVQCRILVYYNSKTPRLYTFRKIWHFTISHCRFIPTNSTLRLVFTLIYSTITVIRSKISLLALAMKIEHNSIFLIGSNLSVEHDSLLMNRANLQTFRLHFFRSIVPSKPFYNMHFVLLKYRHYTEFQ